MILRFYLNLADPGHGESLHIPIRQGNPNPVTFGLVSREWRDISTSRTPGAWSSLHIELPESLGEQDALNLPSLFTLFLQRSQNLPLTVRLVIHPAHGAVSYIALGQVFSSLLAQAYRWQDIYVMATSHSLPLLIHSTVLQAPVSRLVPWNVLQSLDFGESILPLPYSACENVLRSCSSLKHCRLAISIETRYGDVFPQEILLPSLESLYLIEKSLPDHTHPIYELFSCPNLRELTIIHENNQPLNSQQLEFARVSLVKFLERLTVHLYLLHLFEIPTSEAGLYDILQAVPERLTHLLLSHRGRGSNSPITDDLIWELTLELPSSALLDETESGSIMCYRCDAHSGYDSDGADSLACHPILHTLLPDLVDVSVVSNACSDQVIEDFLRSRWAAEWHVVQLQCARFDLLGRMAETDLPARLSDCCAAGLVLQISHV